MPVRLQAPASVSARPKGTIRFACNEYAAIEYLPALLQAFCGQYPGVRLSITTSPGLERLLEATCDLMLHIGQRPDVDVVARQIGKYRRCLCATPEYLAQFGVPRSVEDLSGHRCLSHSAGESREWCFSVDGKLVRQPLAEPGPQLGGARVSQPLQDQAFSLCAGLV